MLCAVIAIGPGQMLIILLIGVLLFGKRLPDIGKQIGKSLLEFQQGFQDLGKETKKSEKNVDATPNDSSDRLPQPPDSSLSDTPKFER